MDSLTWCANAIGGFLTGRDQVKGALDVPWHGETVYQHGLNCEGWVYREGPRVETVEAHAEGSLLGSTGVFYDRRDVAEVFNEVSMLRVGFTVHCIIPEALRARDHIELRLDAVGPRRKRATFARRTVRLSSVDYRQHGHGSILTDSAAEFLKREQVYGSGVPSPVADPACVALVGRYVAPGDSVLDVGCGIGAWRAPLEGFGVRWTGCETRQDLVDEMLSRGLQVVCVEPNRLPYADSSFDRTICIEVLEHIADHEHFVAEVARVSKQGGFFSVPNFAAIPVTSSFYTVPWHMLEADHKNFFTARSLATLLKKYYQHVETFEYGVIPKLRSLEGLEIKNHVFAVARH